MPRPKGSKNKATLSKTTTQTRTEAPAKAKALPGLVSADIMEAIQEFQDALTDSGKQITAVLTQIATDFETLKGSLDVTPKAETKKQAPSASRASAKPAPVDEDDSDDDESDEEPDIDSMSVDELEDFIEEHDLDVDLEDYKGLSKKRQAVADAYEELMDEETDEDESDSDEEDESDLDEEESDTDDDDDWDEPKKPVRSATGKKGRK